MNVQGDFVDQVGFKQTFCQLAAAEQPNPFAFLTLQFTEELRDVFRDDLDVLVELLLCCQTLF